MDDVEVFPIQYITREGKKDTGDAVTKELSLTVILNSRELVTLLCSPTNLNYLAIGFLASEGLLGSKAELKKIIVDARGSVVRVQTQEDKELAGGFENKRLIASSGGRSTSFHSAAGAPGPVKVESRTRVSAPEVFTLVKEFLRRSSIHRTTGGVHSAALCDARNILLFSEDIGRHNALDKIFGECILRDIPTDDRIIITSGRISSEILLKVARRGIPILISKAAPTDLGVRLASDLGVTLIGFVRGERMNVYANGWRVEVNGK